MANKNKIRCAIYTRKSSEDGLEQEFNSLHAQHEACVSYVASQKHEGWTLITKHYDDGGISGGTLERPALQDLMQDVDDGKVDQIVVYKIDRLTRSLADFAKLVDKLDDANASFVSVTQSFNTATSMGRLTLNVLLSFAQFEREVTAERIRDKITASKKKGMWMGGAVPLGFRNEGRTLIIREDEAATVQAVYDLFLKHQNIRTATIESRKLGLKTAIRSRKTGKPSGGIPFGEGTFRHVLENPVYRGMIKHRDKVHQGQHEPIINPETWDEVQTLLKKNAHTYKRTTLERSPLTGKLFDENGDALTPDISKKGSLRHRYYMSKRLLRSTSKEQSNSWRLPAKPLEDKIRLAIYHHLTKPQLSARLLAHQATPCATTQDNKWLNSLTDAQANSDWTEAIERVCIEQGKLTISLSTSELGARLDLTSPITDESILQFEHPFQLRRRGVEQKIIMENVVDKPNKDEVLIRNVAKAYIWYQEVKAGKTFVEIAKVEGVTSSHIRHIIKLAFLAPDIVEDILEGRQPPTLTTKWLMKNPMPSDWEEQRAVLKNL